MTRSPRATGWVLGTVFLILAVFAATWFLLAAPRFEAAASTMLEVENARTQNDLLELQNAKLASDFQALDQFRAEVAALRSQIPGEAQLGTFVLEANALAVGAGVTVLEITPGVPQAFALPAGVSATTTATEDAAAAVEAADADSDTDATEGEGAEPAPAPTGPVVPEGLVAVPVSIKVVGPYANATAFLETLQTTASRLFLVTGVDAIRQEVTEGTAGVPATAAGDVELLVAGQLYVLQEPASSTPPAAEEPDEPAPPLPGSDRNPFVPLGG